MVKLSLAIRKRGGLMILHEMLTTLQTGPLKKTHLMYRTNVNHRQLTKLLTLLLDKGLCAEVRRNSFTEYRITAKGRRFVHEYEHLLALFDA